MPCQSRDDSPRRVVGARAHSHGGGYDHLRQLCTLHNATIVQLELRPTTLVIRNNSQWKEDVRVCVLSGTRVSRLMHMWNILLLCTRMR